jgi:general secretion pathway protein B
MMSYILDALKKSEQERQQGKSPNLQSIHKPAAPDSTSNYLAISLIVLCVCSLSIAAYFYLDNKGPRANTVEITNKEITVEKVETASPLVPSTETNKVVEALAVVEFWQLPDPVQSEIPALTFSFHVYSDNPERRAIIINKRRVKEGDLVSTGLHLTEITPEGVVLRWQEKYAFYIAVVEQW